jgi:hypothetical protein
LHSDKFAGGDSKAQHKGRKVQNKKQA